MTSKELAREVSLRTGYYANACYEIIQETFKVMSDTLASYESISVSNFGTFSVYDRQPRNIYNHATKEVNYIDGYKCPKFTPSASLKDVVRS